MQERRRFVRLAPPLITVTYKIIGQGVGATLQPAKDISQGGIRFSVNERLSPSTQLALELGLPEEATPIRAEAEVVWNAHFHANGSYEVGCRFTSIDPLDRGKLIHHVHEILKQRKPFAQQ